MSHPYTLDDNDGIVMKPRPKRTFELSSAPPSAPSTPPSEQQTFSSSLQPPASMDGSSTPSRTRSILNLTSSTLFGIYQPTGYAAEREEPSTPWGTGAETPVESPQSPHRSFDLSRTSVPDSTLQNGTKGHKARRRSVLPRRQHKPRKGLKSYYLPLLGRTLVLFAVGVLYGALISHLHDRQEIAPVKVEGLDRSGWAYLTFWGAAGVLLGQALPYADRFWAPQRDEDAEEDEVDRRSHNGIPNAWLDVVRSIAAFVGIAFAIRKLPWQSTLQLSLTLALANPAVWYLIDRSPPGFILSTMVSLGGTALLLGINPALVPSPSPAQVLQGHVARHGGVNGTGVILDSEDLVLGVFSQESVGVATWIASVLFVSSVCFGNIGRRLAPLTP